MPPPFSRSRWFCGPSPTVRARRVGNECDSKFQVHESPASGPLVVGISGVTWGADEGAAHVYSSLASLASWRGALPASVSPPAVTRTRPRSRALTRALSHHTEHSHPRASSIPELPPGCAPGLAAAAPMPFSPACLFFFSFLKFLIFAGASDQECKASTQLASGSLPWFVSWVEGGKVGNDPPTRASSDPRASRRAGEWAAY